MLQIIYSVPVPHMEIQNCTQQWFIIKIIMTQPYHHWHICSIRKSLIKFSWFIVGVGQVCFAINVQKPGIIGQI